MIVDTHVHYGGGATAYKVHSADELLAEATAAGVDKIVQVSPGSSVGHILTPEDLERQTRESLDEAVRHKDRIVAVIVRLDIFAADAVERLEKIMKEPNVLGFRITSGNLPGSPSVLSDPKLKPVFAAAERLGAAVQIYAPGQIAETEAIARAYPRLRLLIDHMTLRHWEDRDNSVMFRDWPKVIELAKIPNAFIKVSYFPEAGREFDAYPYPTAQRYFKQLYEEAGPKNLIWGSNFPPVMRYCTYKEALDFVRVHCTFLSAADRDAILGGNFMREFIR